MPLIGHLIVAVYLIFFLAMGSIVKLVDMCDLELGTGRPK